MAEQTQANQNPTPTGRTNRADQAERQGVRAGQPDSCGRENACCGGLGSGRIVGLCGMASGECGIIREMRAAGADAAYLRALGLRPNQRIRLCRASGPWIVEVGCHGGPASRIGLARSLAEQVRVEVNERVHGLPGSTGA